MNDLFEPKARATEATVSVLLTSPQDFFGSTEKSLLAAMLRAFAQTLALSAADLSDDGDCVKVLYDASGDQLGVREVCRQINWSKLIDEAQRLRNLGKRV